MQIGRRALEKAAKPKKQVSVLYTELHRDDALVYYVNGACREQHVQISLKDLEKHVQETYSSSSVMSDVTTYYYIEENLDAVCKTYLESGKEAEAAC